jgi:hypothetical protein
VKRLFIVVGSVLVVGLVLAIVVLRVVGLDPKERRPGLWLSGHVVTTPVTDWSFTDKYPTIFVETRTWYGIPHSVTTSCVSHDGRLYLTSVYREGAQFPGDKVWNRNMVRNPHVRLKIGDQLYDRTLSLVTDAAERQAVLQSKQKKYPRQRVSDKSTTYVFAVSP